MKSKKTKVNIRLMAQEEFDKKVKRSPEMIREYLHLAIKRFKEDKNQELFLYSIMRVVKWVGVTAVARKAHLTRQGIYTALDRKNANPNLNTFNAILDALGVTMTFEIDEMFNPLEESYQKHSANYINL